MARTDELKERIRQQPLNDRLEESRRRIGDMCSKGRCPKMTIPVQHDDDDFYINTTLADAQATIAALQADNRTYIDERHEHMKQIEQLQARVQELESQIKTLTTYPVHSALPPASYISHAKTTKRSQRHDVPTCYSCDLPWPCQASLLEKELRSLYAITTQRTAELHQILAAIDEGLSLNDIGLAVRTVEGVHAELERMKGREET